MRNKHKTGVSSKIYQIYCSEVAPRCETPKHEEVLPLSFLPVEIESHLLFALYYIVQYPRSPRSHILIAAAAGNDDEL